MTTQKEDRSPHAHGPRPAELMDGRLVCWMRLVLALSALAVICLDPAEPDRLVAVTYASLALYSLYGFALWLLSARRGAGRTWRAAHWVDVGWYLLFVALSSGTNSIFFLCFFFSILVASFQWGFDEGMRVTAASALLFTVVGYAAAPGWPEFELNRFLLRPVYLLVLGYMIAYWGGYEIELKQRLALLKDVNTLSNPRFGVGHTITTIMRRVRDFYDADACLLVLGDSAREQFRLTRVGRGEDEGEARGEPLPPEVARQFLALPDEVAVVYNARVPFWRSRDRRFYACDLSTGEETGEGREASARAAAALDADSFISVPVLYGGAAVGRAYLTGCRGDFRRSDIGFLAQIIEHVIPVLNNVRLLDRLASSAAEQERQKIARDIHDSVIQPYIGLQYKVAAIRNKLASGDGAGVAADLEQLFDVTAGEITGLRRYVRGLKEEAGNRDDLLSAVRRYVEQFEDHYGIRVAVEAKTDINVNDRLAAELIQMVHEGLSNVRKHTEAARCAVSFESRAGRIILRVENEGAGGRPAAPFVPRSISERAEDLGGRARVETAPGATTVRVEIPL
jgi:signal transduction histidine kinase